MAYIAYRATSLLALRYGFLSGKHLALNDLIKVQKVWAPLTSMIWLG